MDGDMKRWVKTQTKNRWGIMHLGHGGREKTWLGFSNMSPFTPHRPRTPVKTETQSGVNGTDQDKTTIKVITLRWGKKLIGTRQRKNPYRPKLIQEPLVVIKCKGMNGSCGNP